MAEGPGARPRDIERMLREAAPSALAVLARRTGDFDASEDAMQEALVAASVQWARDGAPEQPRAWLVSVAHRRYVEAVRRDAARRAREHRDALLDPDPSGSAASGRDDSLALFVLCCHPALRRPAQLALTLRAVGGLTTAEIARGLLVPEATVAQRISRAKARIRAEGATFRMPRPEELPDRVGAVCQVLHLMYTEGHTASAGESLARADLSAEAIRLTRMLRVATPAGARWRGEVDGLLALMLLTESRRPARLRADPPGAPPALVPLDEQDRSRWDRALIDEGTALVDAALAASAPGPYQLQAAIAALHAEAPSTEATDWEQVLALYELLRLTGPGPMVELGWVVAVAMVHGPDAALRELEAVALEPALAGHFRVHAVRAHLLARAGRTAEARGEFSRAAGLALNATERRYLEAKAVTG
ncbi:RNA polymerase sigma factor [Agromyces arachidis]|uniref:RNA polymerase sigma factor n=1 Tax=Agromyces arachidis TaxID=766966 RepID=UPI004055CC97